jgi:hypothetical protein
MEYIVIAVIIALVLPTAHAIWKTYDADMDEWEEDDETDMDRTP